MLIFALYFKCMEHTYLALDARWVCRLKIAACADTAPLRNSRRVLVGVVVTLVVRDRANDRGAGRSKDLDHPDVGRVRTVLVAGRGGDRGSPGG